MKVHHLNCGSLCPHGRRLINGDGGLLERGISVCHCLAIESDDGLVLVDTGFGMEDARNPGQLGAGFRALMSPRPKVETTALAQLEGLGFSPSDVRHIAITHLDLDHAGGLPDFPDADVHVLAPELEAALHPKLDERLRYIGGAHWAHGPSWVRHAASGGEEWLGFEGIRIVPGLDVEVLLIPLFGHTRGHTGVAVKTPRGLAPALRRRLLQPRSGRDASKLPAAADRLPERDGRRQHGPQGQPGAPPRARLAPRGRRHPGLRPRPGRARARAGEGRGARRGRVTAASPEALWHPSAELVERSRLTEYMRWLQSERGLGFDCYEELWRWSIDDLDGFWGSIWDFFEVRADGEREPVLAGREMPGAEWFPGTSLNYAEHVFAGKEDDEVAILHASELRELDELSWGELRAQVAAVAGGLRAIGVGPGDRVAAYMPNIPEAIVAFLASASIGAIWSSCSPDFGPASVIDRFAQIEPKVLFAVDGYGYGGKRFDRRDVLAELRAAMPSLERTVVLPYLDPDPDLGQLRGAMRWRELLAAGEGSALAFERVPFDHPLWVLYSSGTTGLPKAIVQGQGGILLEHLKKLHLHIDAHPGDRLFWFTTTGWMMWNFLVSGLLTKAAIVLYDGSPGHPDMGVLWDLAERAGVTMFGTSASYIAACMKDGVEPGAGRDLSRLKSVGSTGSPLAPEGFDWIYDQIGADTWLFSTSGGTDLCTAFVGGVSLLPVYRGELQGRALGAAVEAWDEEGKRGDRRGRRAGRHRADALDAGLLLGRRGRQPLPGQLLRAVPRRLAPRRLDRNHLARHGGHLRALGLDDQPLRRAHGDERDLPRRARRRRDPRRARRRHPPRRAPRAGCRCSSSSAREPSSTTTCAGRSRDGCGRSALPATCRTRSSRSRRCRAR